MELGRAEICAGKGAGLGSEQHLGDTVQSNRAIMGTTAPGPIHLLELCDQKLMELVCNVDNKDIAWLEEIEEEAKRTFTREFSKEPELMPKTPSQKNRQQKRRISYVQDENRDPIRRRLSHRKTRSSRQSSRHLRSKDKLATVVGENGSVLRRVTRAAAAAAATSAAAAPSPTPESPTVLTKKPKESLAQCQLVPVVETGISERLSAEQHLSQLQSAQAPSPTPAPATASASQITLTSEEDSTPPEARGRETGVCHRELPDNYTPGPQGPRGRGRKVRLQAQNCGDLPRPAGLAQLSGLPVAGAGAGSHPAG